MLVTSAELRVPITSVLSGAKLGLTAFLDAGKAFNVGQSMKDAAWHQGVGGGVFLIATIVRINLDVAHGLKDGDTRVHLARDSVSRSTGAKGSEGPGRAMTVSLAGELALVTVASLTLLRP